ncbi:Multidrug resistance protein stp [Streptomyces sp. YIM 121038]|uniref:hypothetical protein n=1 Tax=Streptomyces sp. YIM 121038 TaxID=2136401 RepID=UPI0011103FAD|nr:hypothetical protein [Streptomyces sp. YIM 121038]QCX74628.1 Multidrug resistance protein stp [Streptomyces sp. YIM 121038]
MNLPVVIAPLAGACLWLPEYRAPSRGPPAPLAVAAATTGLRLLVWAVVEGPSCSWGGRLVQPGFTGAVLILIVLARWQRRSPGLLLPPGLLRNRPFSAAAGVLGVLLFALFGSLYVLTLHLQLVLSYSLFQDGLRILPLAAAAALGAALSLPTTACCGVRV